MEFWETIFPTWLSGVGGLIAAAVATWTLIREVSTRKGLRQVVEIANKEPAVESTSVESDPAPISNPAPKPPFALRLKTVSPGRVLMRNIARDPITIRGFDTNSEGVKFVHNFALPLTIQNGEGYEFEVRKPVGGPVIVNMWILMRDDKGNGVTVTYVA